MYFVCILKYLNVILLIYFQKVSILEIFCVLFCSLYNIWFNLLCFVCFLLYLKHLIASAQSQTGQHLHMAYVEKLRVQISNWKSLNLRWSSSHLRTSAAFVFTFKVLKIFIFVFNVFRIVSSAKEVVLKSVNSWGQLWKVQWLRKEGLQYHQHHHCYTKDLPKGRFTWSSVPLLCNKI